MPALNCIVWSKFPIALTIVIEQGEGATGESIKNTVQSHYEVFKELRDDVDKHPLVCYPVVENPITSDYKEDAPKVYKVGIIDWYGGHSNVTHSVLYRSCWPPMLWYVFTPVHIE